MSPRKVVILTIVAVMIITSLVFFGIWAANYVEQREECQGLSTSVCQAIKQSDERECRAGEGCGQPLEHN